MGPKTRNSSLSLVFSAVSLSFWTALPAWCDRTGQNFWSGLTLQPHSQLHPPLVHFPIAFLVLECILVFVSVVKKDAYLIKLSRHLLFAVIVTAIPAAIFGFHDAGDGNGFWTKVASGMADRIKHFTALKTSISLHVFYVDLTLLLALARAVWREVAKKKLERGAQRVVFLILTALNLWLLLAAAQQGGVMMES